MRPRSRLQLLNESGTERRTTACGEAGREEIGRWLLKEETYAAADDCCLLWIKNLKKEAAEGETGGYPQAGSAETRNIGSIKEKKHIRLCMMGMNL